MLTNFKYTVKLKNMLKIKQKFINKQTSVQLMTK